MDLGPVKQFTRGFNIFERLFPGSQISFPSLVRPELQMVAEVMRPAFIHDARLKSDFQQTVSTGADVTHTHPEPAEGFVHLPVLWAARYTGAGQIDVQGVLLNTATKRDPWGAWTASSLTFTSIRAGSGRFLNMTVFPYARGNQFSMQFIAPLNAQTVSTLFLFVEVPGELCDLQTWCAQFGNTMQTSAIP